MRALVIGAIIGAIIGIYGADTSDYPFLLIGALAVFGAVIAQLIYVISKLFTRGDDAGEESAAGILASFGAVWGLISAVGFFIRRDDALTQIIFKIIFAPGYIAANYALGPAAGLLFIFPIVSIIIGAAMGYIVGRLLDAK